MPQPGWPLEKDPLPSVPRIGGPFTDWPLKKLSLSLDCPFLDGPFPDCPFMDRPHKKLSFPEVVPLCFPVRMNPIDVDV